jgi:lysine 6-dehydrogenase
MEEAPVKVSGSDIVPREVFHALLEPQITRPDIKDICIIRIKSIGEKNGTETEATVELMDQYDEITNLTAMQKLTGWHASIIAILAAQGKLDNGALPVELVVPGSVIVEESKRRGLKITEKIIES